tara:strand:- start:25208 stop:26131 length:924 start_codon:yes stop_codon:yes gene_type:complete
MPFSVMFHHFHGGNHKKSQGSISKEEFEEIILWLEKKYKILDAYDFFKKFEAGSLRNNEICFSFDDSLLCQYDIAIPVLRKKNITAFFFIYTSIFTENPDFLEIYRFFRNTKFNSIDSFYKEFFRNVEKLSIEENIKHWNNFKKINYLKDFSFYTENDKWFRYLRENYLKEKYHLLMKKMMQDYNFNIKNESKSLWMKEKHLREIEVSGNIIGLHSHSHPTKISSLSYANQFKQYNLNMSYLKKILGHQNIISMSHPCGDYNLDTLKILKDLGIKIGFRSNMSIKKVRSSLEIPREDHANIMRLIKS